MKVADFFIKKQANGLALDLVIAAGANPESLEKIDGVRIRIDPTIKADFKAWLKDQQIDDAAKVLEIGRSTVFRLRKALGIVRPYDGYSRTTVWRKKKEQSN